jgi:hypothetical protein
VPAPRADHSLSATDGDCWPAFTATPIRLARNRWTCRTWCSLSDGGSGESDGIRWRIRRLRSCSDCGRRFRWTSARIRSTWQGASRAAKSASRQLRTAGVL